MPPSEVTTSSNSSAQRPTTTAENLQRLTRHFVEERPKIDTAVKNFMSYITALKVSANHNDAILEPSVLDKINLTHIMALSRYVLNGINTESLLPEPLQFGIRYPQGEEQTGSDRLDELFKYRVAYMVGKKIREQGGKRTRLFGEQMSCCLPHNACVHSALC